MQLWGFSYDVKNVCRAMAPGLTWWKAPVALVVTAQLLPAPAPAVAALADGPGRLVLRASFRSTNPEAVLVLSADLPATLRELFAGGLPPGTRVTNEALYRTADWRGSMGMTNRHTLHV